MDKMEKAQIKMLIELNGDLYNSFEFIYDKIVGSTKISADNRNKLLALYQNDLCTVLEELLPFCRYNGKKFTGFPTYPSAMERDNYRE
jgi:hypothetical protein